MAQNIAGKVVVITGASSGLGEAAARHLARHGAKLMLAARRLERLQALAKELQQRRADAVLAARTSEGGRMGPHGRCEPQGRALRHRRRAAAYESEQSGHIINVSSVAGHKVSPASAVYSASKTAVRDDVDVNEILFRPTRQEC